MEAWNSFKKSKYGKWMKNFFEQLTNEISKFSSDSNQEEGLLILNTKKAYWMYKVYQRNENPPKIAFVSDRFVQKCTDFSCLKGKRIYLVDDTLSHGWALLETYRMLAHFVEDKNICPVTFALNAEESCLKEKKSNNVNQDFWRKLKYALQLSGEEINELCVRETYMLHQEGIPFSIDLPYLKATEKKERALEFGITLSKAQFELLQKGNELWEFHRNVYDNPMDGKRIFDGFIMEMRDRELLASTSDFALNYIVEGTCRRNEDGSVNIVFIPFTLVKSMGKKLQDDLWLAIFGDDSRLKDCKVYKDEVLQYNSYVKKHRECIFALSLMIAEKFRKFLRETIGVCIDYNYDILKDHFTGLFIDEMRRMEAVLRDDPEYIREKILSGVWKNDYVSLEAYQKPEKEILKRPYDEGQAFELITKTMERNRNKICADFQRSGRDPEKEDNFISVEELQHILDTNFYFNTEEERRYALTRAVVTMLRTSMCNNKVLVDGEKVGRGFRYGENTDLLLPFFNVFFYWAILLMVEKIGKQKLLDEYERVMEYLKREFMFYGIWERKITPGHFQENRDYFKNVLRDKANLYNKCFYLDRILGDEGSEDFICFNRIERSVVKYQG